MVKEMFFLHNLINEMQSNHSRPVLTVVDCKEKHFLTSFIFKFYCVGCKNQAFTQTCVVYLI